MTRIAIVTLLSSLIFLSSCVRTASPPAPFSAQYSGASEAAYRRAYYLGFQDGKREREEDYERYHYEYDDQTEEAFERGYALGYETGVDQAEADESDRDRAKNEGYNSGRTDAENGLSPFYQRHRRNFTEATEPDFRNGYVRGYNAARSDNAPVGARHAYNYGYRQGELDAEQGRPQRPESFNADLPDDDESAYMQGYRDGYRHAVPKY